MDCQIIDSTQELLRVVEEKEAVAAALHSDLIRVKFPQYVFSNANMAICAILAFACLDLNGDQETVLRNQFSKIAYNKNYQGKWNLVEKLVRLKPFFPNSIIATIIKELGPYTFFGNYLRLSKKMIRILQIEPLYNEKIVPVKFPQRKRGYNDKGSYRPVHQQHGDLSKVAREPWHPIEPNPLFYHLSPEENNLLAAELVSKTTSGKSKKSRRRKRKNTMNCNNILKKYIFNEKISKEEWKSIFSCSKESLKLDSELEQWHQFKSELEKIQGEKSSRDLYKEFKEWQKTNGFLGKS